jgi:hypothetical protein
MSNNASSLPARRAIALPNDVLDAQCRYLEVAV